MFHHPNACSCECMPYLIYLIVPRHLCINAWSYHSMFMAYQRKKRNPSLIFEGQTTSKYGRQRLIGMKKVQNKSILYKQNKEIEAKMVRLGFLGMSMCAHTQDLRTQPTCMHTHTSSMRAHVYAYTYFQYACACVCIHALTLTK